MASYDLATLDEVKDFMDMPNSISGDDDLIEDLITRITENFQTYLGVFRITQTTYTEYYDGDGSKFLFVANPPIISITELNDDSDWVWGIDTTMAGGDFRIVDDKYVVLKSSVFTSGDQNIKIIYSGGYATIPNDMKQVCIEEVSRKFKRRRDFDVASKTLEDGTINYAESGLLKSTRYILNKYRLNGIY